MVRKQNFFSRPRNLKILRRQTKRTFVNFNCRLHVNSFESPAEAAVVHTLPHRKATSIVEVSPSRHRFAFSDFISEGVIVCLHVAICVDEFVHRRPWKPLEEINFDRLSLKSECCNFLLQFYAFHIVWQHSAFQTGIPRSRVNISNHSSFHTNSYSVSRYFFRSFAIKSRRGSKKCLICIANWCLKRDHKEDRTTDC